MATIGKSHRIIFISAASALALFFSMGLAIEEAHSGNFMGVSWSGTDDPGSQEFEDSLKTLQADDSYERHRAVIALGRSGKPEAVEPLIKALNDEDLFVQSFAAVALGNLGDRKAVAPLIKALGDEDMIVRQSTAAALGKLGDPSAVDPLIKTLDDEDSLVRRAAAEALGNLGDPRAVDPLLKALNNEDSYIWNGASIALSRIGSAGIPRLVNALGDRVSGPRVAEILKSLNWQPASDEERVRFDVAKRDIKALLQNWEAARKVLLSDAEHGNDRQAENAVHALIGIGQEETLDELDGIMRTRGSKEMAVTFMKSGNAQLSKIADAWAKEHGTEIKAGDNAGAVQWAGWRSSAEQ